MENLDRMKVGDDDDDEVILLRPKAATAGGTDEKIPNLPPPARPYANLRETLREAVNAIRAEHGLPLLPADAGGSRPRSDDACVRCGAEAQLVMRIAPTCVDASIKLCSRCCSRVAGEEERWKGWLPW